MSEDIKIKQQFLRQEIIEKGHDPEAFIEYISELRDGGDDIENWCIKSLEDVVFKYQTHCAKPTAIEPHVESLEPQSLDTNQTQPTQSAEAVAESTSKVAPGATQESPLPTHVVVMEDSEDEPEESPKQVVDLTSHAPQEYMSEQQRRRKELHTQALQAKKATIDYDITSKCMKSPDNEISLLKTIRVVIPSSRLIKGGLFSANYTNYTVVTKPLDYRVERRYNDFFWLRTILAREYPGLYIPPIPKKSEGRNFEQEFLDRRIETLEKFLSEICEHSELRSSVYFSAFLKIADEKVWTAQKEKLDQSISKISSLKEHFSKKMFEGSNGIKLEHFKTVTGEVRSRISKDLRDYAQQTENLLKATYPVYENVELLCQELSHDIEKACSTVNRLCEQVHSLSAIHAKFNELVKEGKWTLMEQLYSILGNSLANWGRYMKKSSESVRNHIHCTFQYSMKEFDSIHELIATRNHAGQEYYKAAQSLEAYKDKLLDSGDLVKWEIPFEQLRMSPDDVLKNRLVAKYLMLPSQNAVLNEMKTIFGYFNHAMVREVTYVSHSRAKRYIRSLGTFCSEQVEGLELQISIFNTLKNNLLHVYELLPEVSESK